MSLHHITALAWIGPDEEGENYDTNKRASVDVEYNDVDSIALYANTSSWGDGIPEVGLDFSGHDAFVLGLKLATLGLLSMKDQLPEIETAMQDFVKAVHEAPDVDIEVDIPDTKETA